MTKQEQLIIIILVLAALIGTGLLYHRKFYQAPVTPEVIETEERKVAEKVVKEIVVDVKGACWRPGVYTFSSGARVKDLMEKASPREDADLKGLNLARQLKDGERIFIPSRPIRSKSPEATVAPSLQTSNGYEVDLQRRRGGKININLASIDELQRLPQIGPKIASYIVSYRNNHGSFTDISEIKNVDRIGEKTFEKIKDLITVE